MGRFNPARLFEIFYNYTIWLICISHLADVLSWLGEKLSEKLDFR